MRKLRPRRGRLLMKVFVEPQKAPGWIHICDAACLLGTDSLRLAARNIKVGPVSPRKVIFSWGPLGEPDTIQGAQSLRGGAGGRQIKCMWLRASILKGPWVYVEGGHGKGGGNFLNHL